MVMTGKNPSTCRKTCPSATLPTGSPTKTELGSNPFLLGEKSENIRLRLGTALDSVYLSAFNIKITCNFPVPVLWEDSKGKLLARSFKDSCSLLLGPEFQRNGSFHLNEVFFI